MIIETAGKLIAVRINLFIMAYGNRRTFLKSAGSIAGASIFTGCLGGMSGGDGEFPSEELVLINPYPPGGSTDIYFGQFIDPLSEVLGVNVRQEYVSGAGSANAMRQIANTDNHHRLTWQDIPIQTILQFDLEDPGFDIRDQVGIADVATLSTNIFVKSGSDYSDFEDLRAAYKNGEISSIGGIGTGSSWHWATWLMKQQWDLQWEEYIAYDGGGPLKSAVLSGEIDAGIILGVAITDFVAEGQVDVIMTVGSESPKSLPVTVDTPEKFGLDATDVRAAGGELAQTIWGAPVMTDDEAKILEDAFMEVMNMDEVQEWADEAGRIIDPNTGDAIEKRLEESFELEEAYREFQSQID